MRRNIQSKMDDQEYDSDGSLTWNNTDINWYEAQSPHRKKKLTIETSTDKQTMEPGKCVNLNNVNQGFQPCS